MSDYVTTLPGTIYMKKGLICKQFLRNITQANKEKICK